MAPRNRPGNKGDVPDEVAAIRAAIKDCLNQQDGQGRVICNAKYGVYCFYDYDNEPIYVGQTSESLRQRIGRHLTNQRTDAVAMNVLDPFEVRVIEMYPLWELADSAYSKDERQSILNRAEYALYQKVVEQSRYHAVLNEADVPQTEHYPLPITYSRSIIPDAIYELRKHPDIRMARRAMTVANLARVISERDVSVGLRRTLLTQVRRLEHLARTRLEEFGESYPQEAGGETGEAPDTSETLVDDIE
ncbi:MAG: GIY-YIG nuclease family protein [Ktedonobacterales bacterium]